MEEEKDDEQNPAFLFSFFFLNIGELKKAQVLDQNTMWINSDIPKIILNWSNQILASPFQILHFEHYKYI